MARTKLRALRIPTEVKEGDDADYIKDGEVDPEPDNKRRKISLPADMPGPTTPADLPPPGPAFVGIGYSAMEPGVWLYEFSCEDLEAGAVVAKRLLGIMRDARGGRGVESFAELLADLAEGLHYSSWRSASHNADLIDLAKYSKADNWMITRFNEFSTAVDKVSGCVSGAFVIFAFD